jgi:NADH:ubiquinone oxidoreductase subunit D/NADH:ubiquinone oxidoreductase subunit C
MPVIDTTALAARINEAVPGAVAGEDAAGIILHRDKLVEACLFLRDDPDLQLDYLANLTSVDYPDRFEVVYNLASTVVQGSVVTIKTHADKADPEAPSVYPVWHGADFQEREVWDLMGIRFSGHPNLKRILLWEGFAGHPLRKDWKEAYFEEAVKPFASRWPEGHHVRDESRVPFGDNLAYPADWDPEEYLPVRDKVRMVDWSELREEVVGGVVTDPFVVNMGPQHPSTHGVLRLRLTLDGETVLAVEPIVGYMHRNHDKIGERNVYLQNMPFTDRLDYVTSMSNNLAYALAVEKLMGIKPTERAEYIRVIMVELTRVMSHLASFGWWLNDLGAFFTPLVYALEEREFIIDLFEMASGARMMCNYMRFGGVAKDLPPEFLPLARELVADRLPRKVDEFDTLLTGNEIIKVRSQGIGVLPRHLAISYSQAGPVLRASGVAYDLRRADPYSIYDRFDFKVITRTEGDTYARYLVRLDEIRQSLRILEQALKQIDDTQPGDILSVRKGWQVRPPKGEVYGRAENPKGELGFYIVSDGSQNPYRYHVRAPAFINLNAMEEMCKGHKIADVVAILGSIDITMGEVDR